VSTAGVIETVSQNVALVLGTGTSLSTSTTYLLEFVNNGTTLTHYSNAASYASGSATSYSAGLTTGVGGRLQTTGGLVELMVGTIYEVVVFSSALSTAQRQQVEGYLATKWGLQGSLPASHPYKNTPLL
jgi:hypothetical protein